MYGVQQGGSGESAAGEVVQGRAVFLTAANQRTLMASNEDEVWAR